jgi:hypothetical protein
MNKSRKTIKELSETDKAYLAGIMDGEGAIYISRKKDPTMKAGYGYRMVLGVANTDLPLMNWLVEATGLGTVKPRKRHSPKHKQAYDWYLWSIQAYQFLKAISPYLKQKKQRATIAMSFMEKHSTHKGYLTPEEANAQVAVYDEMKILNKRGPK